MSDPTGTITVITREDESFTRSDRVELVTKQVDISILRDSFAAFMQNLQSMIDVDLPDEFPFELKEIEFSAEITADGEFKLLGTGVGVEVNSAVTFKLERREKTSAG